MGYHDLKFDEDKLRYDLVLPEILEGIAKALTYGAKKYAPNSWQNVPDAENRYYAALMRHIMAYRTGEMIDKESELHHLYHAACNIMFLLELENIQMKRDLLDADQEFIKATQSYIEETSL